MIKEAVFQVACKRVKLESVLLCLTFICLVFTVMCIVQLSAVDPEEARDALEVKTRCLVLMMDFSAVPSRQSKHFPALTFITFINSQNLVDNVLAVGSCERCDSDL